MKSVRKLLLVAVLSALLGGCDVLEQWFPAAAPAPQETLWVFAQFNVPEEGGGLESYYFFGRVRQSLYRQIADNTTRHGFLRLRDVHYWDGDNRIRAYEDAVDAGDMLFRIEDLRRLKLIKGPPPVGADFDQWLQQSGPEPGSRPSGI